MARMTLAQAAEAAAMKVTTLRSWVAHGWLPLDQYSDAAAGTAGAAAYVGPVTQVRICKVARLIEAGLETRRAIELACADGDDPRWEQLEAVISAARLRWGAPVRF